MQLTWFIFSLKIGEMLWWYAKGQKIKVTGRLNRIKGKTLFAQATLDKILEIK